jgi:hypothetical protein
MISSMTTPAAPVLPAIAARDQDERVRKLSELLRGG